MMLGGGLHWGGAHDNLREWGGAGGEGALYCFVICQALPPCPPSPAIQDSRGQASMMEGGAYKGRGSLSVLLYCSNVYGRGQNI